MQRKILALVAFALFCGHAHAQRWLDNGGRRSTEPNFFEMRDAFENYWNGKTIKKGKGYKPYQRFLHYWETRVDQNGRFPDPVMVMKNAARNSGSSQRSSMVANWSSIGTNSSDGGYAGVGRINCIAFHPTNANTFWVGSPGGGLWKTTNGGTSWTTNSDDFPVLGVSSILVHPTDPNIMYIATGDGDGGDTYSVGVRKSTDGGATWNSTGLTWTLTDFVLIRKLMFDRNDPNTILAATSDGIYRTTDAGVNWTMEVAGDFFDIEAKPDATASTMYGSTDTQVFRSTDDGNNWSVRRTVAAANRIAIAVTAANSAYLYVLCSESGTDAFLNFQRSTDSGGTFTTQATGPNLLGYEEDGSDADGQGYYDLTLAVSPANANEVYVGGVNTWKSTNGGVDWNINSLWTDPSFTNVPTVHADKHAMEWQNNTTLFEGNDGGIYKTTNGGTNWTDLTNGLVISQIYRLGTSQTDSKCINGLQDNGTKLRSTAGVWSDVLGGDGMDCAINPTNSNVLYGSSQRGHFSRSTDGGANWTDISGNIPGGQPSGAWITPFAIHPTTPTTIYAGFDDIWKSTNQGNTWVNIGNNLAGGSDMNYLEIAPSNANYIYTGTYYNLYRTTNGGTNWQTMTIPVAGDKLTALAIHPTTPNTIWATVSNYTAGQKVFKSIDGGATWDNVSGSLPNLPANCIVYQTGSSNGLYVGTDNGVYYRDDVTGDWEAFDAGLPNVEIFDLGINYSTNKILAATYGRGLWISDLYTPGGGGGGNNLCVNTFEPANEAIGTAPTATFNKEYLSQVGSSTDVDYFKIVVTGTIPVPVRLRLYSLPGNFDLYLLNSAGAQIAASETVGTDNEDILYTALPGTYYAKIVGASGANSTADCYSFAVEKHTRLLNVYPASITAPGGETEGTYEITTNCSWEASSNAAWLSIVNVSGNGSDDLQVLAAPNTGTVTRTATITIVGCGFTKNITFKQTASATCSNANEPANNTSAGAVTLVANAARYAQIGSATDVDYYKFQASTTVSTPIHLYMSNLPDDYDLYLEDGAGNVLAFSENSGTSNEEINYTLPPGFHYVRVVGYDGAFSTSQCYHLAMTKSTKVLKVYPTLNTVEASAGSTPFSVISNVTWTIEPAAAWLSSGSTGGFGSGTIWLNYSENTGATDRTGASSLSGAGTTVSIQVKQLHNPNNVPNPESDVRGEDVFEAENTFDLENFDFVIYPNPTTGLTNFETAREGRTTVTVYDSFGRQILRTEGESLIQLDLSRQPSGVYRIRMDNEGKVAFSNLVLMK